MVVCPFSWEVEEEQQENKEERLCGSRLLRHRVGIELTEQNGHCPTPALPAVAIWRNLFFRTVIAKLDSISDLNKIFPRSFRRMLST